MNQLELIEKELRNNDNTLFHIYLYNKQSVTNTLKELACQTP